MCLVQQRSLGRSGLAVSRLGLGLMTWGNQTDEHEAREQLTAFMDAGGTLLDTAHTYAGGASEELLGKLLAEGVSRRDVVVATKAGVGMRRGARVMDTSRGYLLSCLDLSLQRLGVDSVDLWQVHVWSDRTPIEETLSALDTAVSTGRAAYVGVSNWSGWRTAQARHLAAGRAGPGAAGLDAGRVLPAQPAHRARGGARPPIELGLGILPWSPLGRGVLTGKYRTGTPADSRGASDMSQWVDGYRDEPSSAVVEAVVKAAEGLGVVSGEVGRLGGGRGGRQGARAGLEAARGGAGWVRDQPGVTAPILGATPPSCGRRSRSRRRRCPLS